jgi:hypothetical protein
MQHEAKVVIKVISYPASYISRFAYVQSFELSSPTATKDVNTRARCQLIEVDTVNHIFICGVLEENWTAPFDIHFHVRLSPLQLAAPSVAHDLSDPYGNCCRSAGISGWTVHYL